MVWNNPRFLLLTWFVLGCALASAVAQAADPGAAAPEWQVRTFRIRSNELGLLGSDLGPLLTPSPVASDQEQIEAIRATTKVVREYLQRGHILLPEGTACLFDAPSATLAVRTTTEAMADFRSWSRESLRKTSRNMAFTVQVIDAPEVTLRGILQTASVQANQASVWAELKPLIDQGKAHILTELHCDTCSGERASAEVGPTLSIVTGVLFNEKGGIELTRGDSSATRFEIDPVLMPNNEDIAINTRLIYQFAPPEDIRTFIGQTTSLGRIELPGKLFHAATISCATTVCSGMDTLLGIWKPPFAAKEADHEMLQAAFLRTYMTPTLPSENLTLATKLTKWADQAEPIPAKPKTPDLTPPKGMKTVRMIAPRDLLSMVDAGTDLDSSGAPDPFAARPGATSQEPREPSPLKRPAIVSAQVLLEQAGIAFPPGAWARFDPDTAMLTVTNTPAMIDQVEAFFSSVLDGSRPPLIVNSFQIIEADAALMRPILAEDAQKTDRSESRRKLQELVQKGQAKVVSVLRLLTRSGQRVRCDVGTESLITKEFKPDEKGRLKATLESTTAGTSLELDEVLGPDGYIIDVDAKLDYHYAPPTRPVANAPGKDFEIAQLATEFHMISSHAKQALDTGTTMLVGAWKPEGVADANGKEVLQAAFLQVSRVYLEP